MKVSIRTICQQHLDAFPQEQEALRPLLAAYRECEEETGITADRLRYLPLSDGDKDMPFNIMVQNVPEYPVRHEPAHHHYDFWYLFTVSDDTVAASDDPGVTNHQWVPLVEFAENLGSTRAGEKVEKLLTTA